MLEYMAEKLNGLSVLLDIYLGLNIIFHCVYTVLGTALAYNMLLDLPFWAGVLICGTTVILLLGLQSYGVRHYIPLDNRRDKGFTVIKISSLLYTLSIP